VRRREGSGRPSEFVRERCARVRSEPDGWVELDRDRRTSTVTLPGPAGDRELVHPYLASTAGVAAHWHGQQSFHAGAVVVNGAAWGLLGERGAGKSSLLAQLALDGVPVLADDVLVVRRLSALAGPRCIDLREEPAAKLGVGEALGVVGRRSRWRMKIGPVSPEVPLAGLVRLAWGEPAVTAMPPQERLTALLASRSLRVDLADPDGLLELLTVPMHALSRPRDFGQLAGSAQQLLRHLERASQ